MRRMRRDNGRLQCERLAVASKTETSIGGQVAVIFQMSLMRLRYFLRQLMVLSRHSEYQHLICARCTRQMPADDTPLKNIILPRIRRARATAKSRTAARQALSRFSKQRRGRFERLRARAGIVRYDFASFSFHLRQAFSA